MNPAFDADHTILTTVLSGFSDVVEGLGGDPDELLDSAGLDPSVLTDPPRRIRFEDFERLMDGSAARLNCADFGMRLAEPKKGPEVFKPLDRLIRNSPSLKDIYDFTAPRMDLVSTAIRLTLVDHPNGRLTGWRYDFEGLHGAAAPQISELFLKMTHSGMINLTGGRVRPREIWFAHSPLSSEGDYARNFGSEVSFGQCADVLFCEADDMRQGMIGSRPELFEREAAQIRRTFPPRLDDATTRIRHAIRLWLPSGNCEREEVAADLNLSVRTMNRRLSESGYSFATLRDDVRKQLALRYLAIPGLSLSDITAKLGFTDSAVLCRSSRRWFGETPQTVRRALTAGGAGGFQGRPRLN